LSFTNIVIYFALNTGLSK